MGFVEVPYKDGRKGIRLEYYPPEFNHNHLIQIMDYSNETEPKLLLSLSLQRLLSKQGYKILEIWKLKEKAKYDKLLKKYRK